MLKWLDNFWYHHKWAVIISSFFVVFIVIGIVQMATKTEYDLKMVYAGPSLMLTDERADGVESVFSDFITEDITGDGKKTTLLNCYTVISDEQLEALREQAKEDEQGDIYYDPALRSSTFSDITSLLATGEVSICLFDEYVYTTYCDTDGMFVPLSDMLGETPSYAYDEYAIALKDTDFASYFGAMSAIPEDTLICVRQISYLTGADRSKDAVREHELAVETFKKIIAFDAPNS